MKYVLSRAGVGSGAAFIVLDAVALFLPGPPPKASDSARDIAATLAGARTQVLVGMLVAGLAMIALLVFLGAIREWLEPAPSGPVLVAVGGALLGLGLQLLGLLLFYGATFQVAGLHHDAVVRGLTDGGNAAIEMSKFAFAAFIAAVCVAARGRLPTPLYASGLAVAAVLLVTTMPLLSEGTLTQFGGGVDLLGALPAFAWIGALSVVLTVRERTPA